MLKTKEDAPPSRTHSQTQTYLRMYTLESLKICHMEHLHVDSHALHHKTILIFFGELHATLVYRQIGEHSGCLTPLNKGLGKSLQHLALGALAYAFPGWKVREPEKSSLGSHPHCPLTPPLPFTKA